jgi:hypothetical protein
MIALGDCAAQRRTWLQFNGSIGIARNINVGFRVALPNRRDRRDLNSPRIGVRGAVRPGCRTDLLES